MLINRLTSVQERTRDAARQVALRDISNAIETFAMDNGWLYPKASFLALENSWKNNNIIQKVFAAEEFASVEQLKDILLWKYIKNIPTDSRQWLQAGVNWNCNKQWEYFAYYTEESGKMYAITAISESRRWNTTNCWWEINTVKGDFFVAGKWLKNYLFLTTPSEWYDGKSNPFEWCKQNMTEAEANELNDMIARFGWEAQEISNRCSITEFSIQNGTFWAHVSNNPNAWQKIAVPMWLNKMVWLQKLDLSQWIIQTIELNYPMFFLDTLVLDWNKHLKELILPASLNNLKQFVLTNSLLSKVTLPKHAPQLTTILIDAGNLRTLDLPDDTSSITEIIIHDTKLESITLPAQMDNLQLLDLRNNNFKKPLPQSTCDLLRSRGRTSSSYISNFNKICN